MPLPRSGLKCGRAQRKPKSMSTVSPISRTAIGTSIVFEAEVSVRSVDEVRPAASIEKIGPSGAMSPIAGDVSTWPGVV